MNNAKSDCAAAIPRPRRHNAEYIAGWRAKTSRRRRYHGSPIRKPSGAVSGRTQNANSQIAPRRTPGARSWSFSTASASAALSGRVVSNTVPQFRQRRGHDALAALRTRLALLTPVRDRNLHRAAVFDVRRSRAAVDTTAGVLAPAVGVVADTARRARDTLVARLDSRLAKGTDPRRRHRRPRHVSAAPLLEHERRSPDGDAVTVAQPGAIDTSRVHFDRSRACCLDIRLAADHPQIGVMPCDERVVEQVDLHARRAAEPHEVLEQQELFAGERPFRHAQPSVARQELDHADHRADGQADGHDDWR